MVTSSGRPCSRRRQRLTRWILTDWPDRRSHGGIDLADYLVAAAVKALGSTLITLNVRHFPMFPDLEPAYG
jgi:predicted nucleic acid-binding protein